MVSIQLVLRGYGDMLTSAMCT